MSPDARLPTGTVTFLFTDIEGSTRLLSELPDQYPLLLGIHDRILRTAIAGHGGTKVRTEGDAFFAVFPSARGAVAAVTEAQRALATTAWPERAEVHVRMGLHTGEGRIGGDDYIGLDVHRAARVAAAGHGGQVVLSAATQSLVEHDLPDGLSLRDLGQHRLKDLSAPMHLWQLDIDGLPTEFPAVRTLDAHPGNLPPQLTSFVGRERELTRLQMLVGEHRLVTLTGAGGTGKTRLALEAAGLMRSEFRDGAFFVDLSTVTDPAMVPLTVAQALRLSVDPGGDALKAVLEYLRGREVLLIIDNFEQVVDAVATVESILAAAPRVRLLVTSRKPLLVYGEQEYEVPPFALPHPEGGLEELTRNPAVALFVDRTCAMKPDFALTEENATAVAGITARLDGLPLAIELAAGRSRALTPQSILSRLDSGLSLLAGRSHSRPDRQQTMRDAIRWSYDLLAPAERPLFARLSVFAGGCSLEAAEAVDDPGDMTIDVLDVLGTLIEQSLLRQVDSPGEEARFAMLETILEFAGERLREEFDPDATQRRFASYFMALAEEAQPHLTTVDQVASLDRCQQEAANLRAAIRWAVAAGEPEIGLRTASALWRFWQQRGPLWEGRQALDQLLELAGPSDAVRARALGAAGSLAWWDGDYGAARRQYEEAVPLSRQGGDRRVEMEALYNLASVVIWSDRAAAADDLIRQSMAIAEEIGDGKGVARAKHGLGFVAIVKGDFRAAISAFEESARMFEDLGERVDLTDAVIALGNVNRRLGENERARTFYLRGLDMTVAAGNRPMSVGLLFLLSSLEADRGRPESAARLWGAGEAARAVIGAVRPAVSERIIGDPITAARLMIGDVAVEAALAEGRRMEPDAAIAYAREDS